VLRVQILSGESKPLALDSEEELAVKLKPNSDILSISLPQTAEASTSNSIGVCSWFQHRQRTTSPTVFALMADDVNSEFGIQFISISSKYLDNYFKASFETNN